MMSGRTWISVYPGVALIVLIIAITLVGDQLRDQTNPRLAGDRPLLEVRDLRTHFLTRAGVAKAVDGSCPSPRRRRDPWPGGRQRLRQVGHRFSLLAGGPPGRIVGGPSAQGGNWLASREEMRALPQAPRQWCSRTRRRPSIPVLSIGTQMALAVQAHDRVSGRAARDRAAAVLTARRHPGCGAAPRCLSARNSRAACASASQSPPRCCTARP